MGGTGCCRNDGKRVEGTFALKTMSLRLHSMIVSQKKIKLLSTNLVSTISAKIRQEKREHP